MSEPHVESAALAGGTIERDTPLSALARRDLIEALSTETVSAVAQRMRSASCSSVVVIADGEPVGVWTEANTLGREMANPDVSDQRLDAVMSHPAVILPAEATIAEAWGRLRDAGIPQHLAVTDTAGRVTGLVNLADLLATSEPGLVQELEAALADTRERLRATEEERCRRERVEAKLRERVKELRTLRDIILLSTDDQRTLPELLDECVDKMQAGWQDPEKTAIRLRAGGVEAISENFFEGRWQQHAGVDDPEAPIEMEVFRDDPGTTSPFLVEEQELLDAAAQQFHNALLRRQAQQELKRLATHDSLTDTYNRTGLYQLLEQAQVEYERYGTPFSVIMFDIDHFKAVNDQHGHQTGDEVLRRLARRVNKALRDADVLGRWGGEEFLVIATHTQAQGAAELAERLRQRIARRPFEVVGRVTISLGVATHEAGETVERLEGRVDKALYRAKAAGRDRVAVA
ncbi:MAG: diguanylate cyclase [Pseudomonadota bacterium]